MSGGSLHWIILNSLVCHVVQIGTFLESMKPATSCWKGVIIIMIFFSDLVLKSWKKLLTSSCKSIRLSGDCLSASREQTVKWDLVMHQYAYKIILPSALDLYTHHIGELIHRFILCLMMFAIFYNILKSSVSLYPLFLEPLPRPKSICWNKDC